MPLPPEYRSTVFLLEGAPAPLPSSFAIVTAWNPMDENTPAGENEEKNAELRRELELRHLPYFRATGCSPDLRHREPGWAVVACPEDALALGKKFRQRAIWRIEQDNLIIVDCANGSMEAIASFSSRLR
ncbi:DUF3293 domain-containing protein [Luteolibacter sp. Populi]|uniref:DUF3293 domain-containing protein n=1 Tax=Luteolibacter sp. Populi TaxID=3230487 RepID=UPI003467113A